MSELAISLDKNWRFRAVEPNEQADLASGRLPSSLSYDGWKTAYVPGCVHLDLINDGKVADPLVGTAQKDGLWIESQDFLYKTSFLAPADWAGVIDSEDQRVELHFESLDTFATIYLNGEAIARSKNQFLPLTVDISKQFRSGENILVIHFESAARYCAQMEVEHGKRPAEYDTGRVYARRAQYTTGWSTAPRLSGCGIAGYVNVRLVNSVAVRSIHTPLKLLTKAEAKLSIEAEFETLGNPDVIVETVVERLTPVGSGTNYKSRVVFEKQRPLSLKAGKQLFSEKAEFGDPVLWWPAGFGAGRRTIYRAKVQVRIDGNVVDSAEDIFGLRNIELGEDSTGPDSPLSIRINGEPVFVRGAMWLPPDMFPARVSDVAIRRLLDQVAAANINLLRVWGGGTYMPDSFYRRCDEMGIMVWQDFMFLQGDYPSDNKALWSSITHEVKSQVKRLRNHPSLVMWCGNDGAEHAQHERGDDYKENKSNRIFYRLIPHVLEQYDPKRPYRRSSPWGGSHPNAAMSGDYHAREIWDEWHPIEKYHKIRARFVSNFGFQALPRASSVAKFTDSRDKSLNHPDFEAHQRQEDGNARLFRYLLARHRNPESFEELVYLSQFVQAEALTTAIDAFRANKPECMGAIIWHFNDIWPSISWSLVDYYARPKLAFWAVREAYSPLRLIMLPAEEGVRAVVVDDTSRLDGKKEYQLRFKTYALDGELIDWIDKSFSIECGGKTDIDLFDYSTLKLHNPSASVVVGELTQGKRLMASRLFAAVEPKKMLWEEPQVHCELDCIVSNKRAVFVVRSENIVRGFELGFPNLLNVEIRFDNAVDLWPSREVWIHADVPRGVNREDLMSEARFRCLNDAVPGRSVEWRALSVTEGKGLAAIDPDEDFIPFSRVHTTDEVRKISSSDEVTEV